MPNLNGIDATRQITRRDHAPSRLLILTTFDLDEYVYQALRAGASGFLRKATTRVRVRTWWRAWREGLRQTLARSSGFC